MKKKTGSHSVDKYVPPWAVRVLMFQFEEGLFDIEKKCKKCSESFGSHNGSACPGRKNRLVAEPRANGQPQKEQNA